MQTATKIGLVVEGTTVPFWVAEAIRDLLFSGEAEFPLVVQLSSADPNSDTQRANICNPASGFQPVGWNYAAYRGYQNLDARLKKREPAYDTPVPLKEVLPDTDVLFIESEADSSDLQAIESTKLDILFNTCSFLPDEDITRLASFGVWSYCNGDGYSVQSEANGFREMTSGAATTGVSLKLTLAGNQPGKVISSSQHLPDILLLGRQRHDVLMQASSQLPAAVRRLQRLGWENFLGELSLKELSNRESGTNIHSQVIRTLPYPGNVQTVWALLRHGCRYAGLKVRKLLFQEQWCLLARYLQPEGDSAAEPAMELADFTEIKPPRDRIWADPFVVADDVDNNRFHIFIEEMELQKGHGHISVLTIDRQGNHQGAVPIIERPYHMSYPFIFEFQGERFMIPETGENLTVQLYRCVEFPHRWEFVQYLMEGRFAVDTTLHEADGRWWMFTTLRDNNNTDCLDELHIFHADSPLSTDWQPHPQNPVSRDVTVARPGGHLFRGNVEYAGKLMRPSQNGGYHYGWGISINEVTRLDEEVFEETLLRTLEPGWHRSVIATHTLNHANGMTVSDIRKLRFRWKPGTR